MWERYVGSQAAAVLIRRLYVLTWIPAWCGVFFISLAVIMDIYIISRVSFTRCGVFRFPSLLEASVQYDNSLQNVCLVPVTLCGLAALGVFSHSSRSPLDHRLGTDGHNPWTLQVMRSACTRIALRGQREGSQARSNQDLTNLLLHFPLHHQDPHDAALIPLSGTFSTLTQLLCPTVAVLHSPPILANLMDSICFGKKQHVACPARQLAVTVRPGALPRTASFPNTAVTQSYTGATSRLLVTVA